MIGDYDASIRIAAAQDHMAAGLAAELEAGVFESRPHVTSRQIGGEPGTISAKLQMRRLRGLDLDEFFSGLGRDRVAGISAVLKVECDRFPDIRDGLGTRITLAHAARKGWNTDHVSAI